MAGKIKTITSFVLLCMTLTSTGQDQSKLEERLRKSFTDYCRAVPWEEVFIHTDREAYVAGEEIWFSALLFDRQSGKSVSRSLVYVEVLNGENMRVAQKRIRIGEGASPGCITLPDTLSSGNYTVRAYSDYMKNFLPHNCYSKNILIYNAFKPGPLRIQQNAAGIAADTSMIQTKAAVAESGLKLEINNTVQGTMNLVVRANDAYRNVHSGTCYLLIQTRGNIDMIRRIALSSAETRISYPRSELRSGINQITLFNSWGQPVCEVYTYTKEPHETSIAVTSPDSLKTRSQLNLNIYVDGTATGLQMDSSSLSISVVPVSSFPDRTNLTDYLNLGSEFGFSANDIKLLGRLADMPSSALDSLMSTLRSLWIDWGKIISGSPPRLKYTRETDSHHLTGKLISYDEGFSVDNQFIIMSSPGRIAQFQYSKTDRDGNFSFDINIDEALNDLIIQPDKSGPNRAIRIESSFSESYQNRDNVVYTGLKTDQLTGLSQMSANYQVNKIYGISYLSAPSGVAPEPVWRYRFYGKPDIGLVLADYIRLPVMQEVFFELLPGATLKSKKSDWEIGVTDPVTNRVYDEPPTLMVDGIKIPDAGIIAGIDPELVERIDVLRERYFVGDYLFYGLVNVITNRADFSITALPDYAIRMRYRVTEPVPSFAYPNYSASANKPERIPDFRNTLFWAPMLKNGVDGKGEVEFCTSDVKGEYEINIQGLTSGGEPVSCRKIIKVY